MHELADDLGGLINALTKPAAVKSADQMFTGISGALKKLGPGAVSGLVDVEKAITSFADWAKKMAGPLGGLTAFIHTIETIGHGVSDVMHMGDTAAKWVSDLDEYVAGSVSANTGSRSALAGNVFENLTSGAKTAGKQAGDDFNDGLDEALAVKAKGHLDSLTDDASAKAAGAKQGKDISDATAQAMRQSPALKTAAQDALDKSAKDVKLHGVKVDLSDAKLSGLTQPDSVLQKAAETAGKDYDTALAKAIDSSADVDTSAAKKLATDIVQAMSGLKSQMETIGEAAAQGLAAGIRADTPEAVAAATAMAAAVESAAKSALQSHSPSLVAESIGKDFDLGMAEGIKAGSSGPVSAVTSLMDQLVAQAKAGGKTLEATIKADIANAEAVAKATSSAAASYASLSSIEGEGIGNKKSDEYPNLQTGMEAKLLGIQHFYSQLKKLKKEGLSESLIKQIAEAGPQAGQQEAEQLLKSGKSGIKQADKIEAAIEKWTRYLGREAGNAATEPYKDIGKPIASALKSALRDVKIDGTVKVELGNVNIKVELDGKTLANQVQKLTLQRANRNTSSGLKINTRGA